MADLLDIAPSTSSSAHVWIDGKPITVYGISFDALALLAAKFPELKTLANGGFGDDIVPRLIQFCGRAVGPIIAAGCRQLGKENYEEIGAQLIVEHQGKLLNAILGLTFPNGISSFIAVMKATVGGLMGETGANGKIRIRSRNSRLRSQPSSAEDSRPMMQ